MITVCNTVSTINKLITMKHYNTTEHYGIVKNLHC